MKICVQGLWHLGTVTAACLASLGHEVVGYDADEHTIEALRRGNPPVLEPELAELVQAGSQSGRLRFSSARDAAAEGADVLWVTYDTPVDDEDRADTRYVIERVEAMLPHLPPDCAVLVSSQLPVGSVAALQRFADSTLPELRLAFACSPENLRIGKAIDVFLHPDRIVVGVRNSRDRTLLAPLMQSITDRVEWMLVESAEMTKHAINAFLALSVTFANELATLCERVGADAKEVERGLKSEARIGPRAYLAPGIAFAGGTLARDVAFLGDIASQSGCSVPVLESIRPSNQWHAGWTERMVEQVVGEVRDARIAIWGLTYKPGTDTLRRSAAIELCRSLMARGAQLIVHDPVVGRLPDDFKGVVERAENPIAALRGAAGLAVCTEWPEYRNISAAEVGQAAPGIGIVDANRFLSHLAGQAGIRYFAVGTPQSAGA